MTENRRVLHGAAPSAPVLVVSGLGDLWEYLFATAIALRARQGAEVAFASRQALPEVLAERAGGGYREALLLGVGLSADPARLGAALRALRKTGITIRWISAAAFPVPPEVPEEVRSLFEAHVGESDNLPGAVEEALGGGEDGLLELHADPARTAVSRAWRERVDAAGWSFANSHDFAALESIARDLAGRVSPDRWDAGAKRLVEAFRQFGYRRLQTSSPAMRRLRKDISRVARSRAMRVLVTGESGVGKETVAQQIHVQSGRSGPFLAFNCATVAKDLLESRLFGHAKGAFTGATEARRGLFREADGGTLFLDEIGELPGELQGVLLRVLQEGRILPVGERETKVDVRVVAATNRDLATLVREGRFREDLFWRLSAVTLEVPPLRARKEDFRSLVRELWKSFAPGRKPISEEDIALLAEWDWPGNVRQLANVLERAAIFEDRTIAELLAEEKARSGNSFGGAAVPALPASPDSTDDSLDAAIKTHIRRVLEKCGGNASAAARALGISRNTVRAHLDHAEADFRAQSQFCKKP